MSEQAPREPTSPLAQAQGDGAAAVDNTSIEQADAEVLESGDEVEDASQPPQPPPPKRTVFDSAPNVAHITDQDREFVLRVFQQVRDVDFRAPPPPPPKKDLAGPDRKIAALRQTVHELERDLARVGYVWGAMQQQYQAVDQLVCAKETDREAALARYNQIKELSAQTAKRDRAEIDAQGRRIAELESRRIGLEAEMTNAAALAATRLQRVEQEKATLMAEYRSNMESAQQAFNQLRETSGRAITDLETLLKQRDEDLAIKVRDLDATAGALAERTHELEDARSLLLRHEQTIADRDTLLKQRDEDLAIKVRDLDTTAGALAARTRDLEDAKATVARHDQTIADLRAATTRQDTALSEASRSMSTLTDELSRLRAQHESVLAELRDSLKAKDDLVQVTRGEVRSARAEFAQLAEQNEGRRIDLEKANAELLNQRAEIDRLKVELTERSDSLNAMQSALNTAQEEARLARSDAQAIGQELTSLQQK